MGIVEKVIMGAQKKVLQQKGVHFLTMGEVSDLAAQLVEKVSRGYDPEVVVGIERGGTFPGRCVARGLGVPYVGVDISREKTYIAGIESGELLVINKLLKKQEDEPVIKKEFNYVGNIKRALLVDDDCGSMQTLDLAKEHLESRGVESRSSVILNIPGGTPDFFADMQNPLSRYIKGEKRFPWSRYSPHFVNYCKWMNRNN